MTRVNSETLQDMTANPKAIVPNDDTLRYYFYFMQERMNVFWRKVEGMVNGTGQTIPLVATLAGEEVKMREQGEKHEYYEFDDPFFQDWFMSYITISQKERYHSLTRS